MSEFPSAASLLQNHRNKRKRSRSRGSTANQVSIEESRNALSQETILVINSTYEEYVQAKNNAKYLKSNNSPHEANKTSNQFNIFRSILNYPDEAIHILKYLHPKALLELYCSNRKVYEIINDTFYFITKECASIWAPAGLITFPYQSLHDLVRPDPAGRLNYVTKTINGVPKQVKLVPGFKWLQMAAFRNDACIRIMGALGAVGQHRVPRYTAVVLQKLWFTMEIANNAARSALLANAAYWADVDLKVAVHFFVKLDMRLGDAMNGRCETGLRTLLMSQKSLVPMLRMLTHDMDELDVYRMHVRYNFQVEPENKGLPVFGVAADEIGRWQYEGWGTSEKKMLRVDEGVIQAAARREIGLCSQDFLQMVLYGYQEEQDLRLYRSLGKLGMPYVYRGKGYTIPAGDPFYAEAEKRMPGIMAMFCKLDIAPAIPKY